MLFGVPCKRRSSVGADLVSGSLMTSRSEKKLSCKRKKDKCKGKMFSHCNWICASRKHVMYGSLRCLKNFNFHNCSNLFFVPEPLRNSDKEKLLNFRTDLFYHSVISPFAVNLFLLPFTSHCSTQNIGFSDFGYVIKPPNQSPLFTELRLWQGTVIWRDFTSQRSE